MNTGPTDTNGVPLDRSMNWPQQQATLKSTGPIQRTFFMGFSQGNRISA